MLTRALAFSGGKDSWACLWLHEEELASIQVFFIDTGKNVPEVLESVYSAQRMCPNFVIVKVDREAQNKAWGLPSDVVPINWTKVGQAVTCQKPVMVQSYLDCCHANISRPIVQFCKDHGIKELIMGQRNDDTHRSPRQGGMMVEGILWIHPIETWTREQVMAYLREKMPIPNHFKLNHSSVDCYDCTAYETDTWDKVIYLSEHHPELYQEYAARRKSLNMALQTALGE